MLETTRTDLELIKFFRQGDSQAATVLHGRYYPKVLALCRSYFYSLQDAEDAAQNIFIKLLVDQKIVGFRGTAKFWTWLYRVTSNACYSYLARNTRLARRSAPKRGWVWLENAPTTTPNPEEQNSLDEKLAFLEKCIDNLPSLYRAPLVLVCLRGYTYAQAARKLRITTNTLGVRLGRAKKQLQKDMLPKRDPASYGFES